MDEKQMCAAIQAEIDKPVATRAGAGALTASSWLTAWPWVTLTFKFIVKKVSDIAVETCLSGLELAGLSRAKIRTDTERWLETHP